MKINGKEGCFQTGPKGARGATGQDSVRYRGLPFIPFKK